MDISNQFINFVKLDDKKRILISVKPIYQSYLHVEKNKQLLKKAVVEILKDDFRKLEIGKNMCRITVLEGTEEKNLQIAKNELIKGLEMAMKFVGKM